MKDQTLEKSLMEQIGRRVKYLRTRRKITQGKFAEELGISRNAVIQTEAGRYSISVWRLCKMAEVLRTLPEDFLVSEKRWNLIYTPVEKDEDESR